MCNVCTYLADCTSCSALLYTTLSLAMLPTIQYTIASQPNSCYKLSLICSEIITLPSTTSSDSDHQLSSQVESHFGLSLARHTFRYIFTYVFLNFCSFVLLLYPVPIRLCWCMMLCLFYLRKQRIQFHNLCLWWDRMRRGMRRLNV